MLPRSQVTIRFTGLKLQIPCVDDAEPKPAFFGRLSVSVTPFAMEGPLFLMSIV